MMRLAANVPRIAHAFDLWLVAARPLGAMAPVRLAVRTSDLKSENVSSNPTRGRVYAPSHPELPLEGAASSLEACVSA